MIAAHAHEVAAASHGKGDHLSGREASSLALEHATKAFAQSQDAERHSAEVAREAKHAAGV